MYEPLYSKRYDVVNGVLEVEGVTKEGSDETAKDQIEEKGVSDFWLNAMKNHEILAEEKRDEEALKYLKDIKWFRITEPKGFKLEFHFDTNPFFKNAVLTKTYQMIDEDEPILEKAVGTKIEWYPGKCLTQKVLKEKPEKGSMNAKPNMKTETCESFFNFFSPPQVPDDDEEIDEDTAEQLQNQMVQDYDIGSTIRDKIIPHAVSGFTGEAAQDGDFELEGEEDEDDEDDDNFSSCRPVPVIQIQRLFPLPLLPQEFFPCHLPPPCPEACPGAGSMYLEPSLPDDVLADVLRRLAPCSLAVSRRVCKSWRRVVDGHCLLRADLLPLSLGGIFLNLHQICCTQFLSRPTTGAAVSGRLYYTLAARHPDYDFVPFPKVLDHCNGLLLLRHCVVNPATRQWASLPPAPDLPQPPPGMDLNTRWYLMFDPTLSPNYFDVLIMPEIPSKLEDECEELEWPPYTLTLPVFSSKTSSWEERTFRREGEAAGMLPAMVGSYKLCNDWLCAYWRGALYICCSDCFVLRISLSDNTHRVIRLPMVRLPKDYPLNHNEFYLGKSIKGIYCASLPYMSSAKLKVWFLNDLNEWELKHDRDIFPILPNLNYDEPCDDGPWILQEFDYHYQRDAYENGSVLEDKKESTVEKEKFEAIAEEKFEWDSDNDNVLEPGSSRSQHRCIDFLGFHPYKEVALLGLWDRVLAYHWPSSKLQILGKLFPKFYCDTSRDYFNKLVTESFPYTPCWLGELPEKLNMEARLED